MRSPTGTAFNCEIFLQNCIGDYLLFVDLQAQSVKDCVEILKIAPTHDIIIGTRLDKKQNLFEKIFSRAFYASLRIFGDFTKCKHNYSDFCVLNRKVIHSLLNTQTQIKLLRLVQFDGAFSKYEYPFTPLAKSPSKSFLQNLNLGIDYITQHSFKLLRIGTILCLLMAFFNFCYGIFVGVSFLLKPYIEGGWTSSSLYAVSVNFVIFLMLCILGEYLRVILLSMRKERFYEVIDEKSNLELYIAEKNVETQKQQGSK